MEARGWGVFGVAGLISLLASLSACNGSDQKGCDSDLQCRDGRFCVDGRCQGSPAPNGDANATANADLNGSTNMTPNADPNADPNIIVVNADPNADPNGRPLNVQDEAFEVCSGFCDLLLRDCVEQTCDVPDDLRPALNELYEVCMFEGFEEGDPGCLEAVEAEPELIDELRQVAATWSCDGPELHEFRCAELDLGEICGCDPGLFPDIGDSCDANSNCDGGGLPGVCLDDSNEPPFPDGYCVSFGCPLGPDGGVSQSELCGVGNICVPAGDNADMGICVDGCNAHADCRPGYQCRLISGTNDFDPIRICLAECSDNLACRNANERCNDGRCEFECTEDTLPLCQALGYSCLPDDGRAWCTMP